MMDFCTATDAPVIWRWGGSPIALPLWTLDDLKTLLARLQAEKIEELQKAAVEARISKIEWAYMLARARCRPLGPADAQAYFQSAQGVEAALRLALQKAAIAPAQMDQMLAGTPFDTLFELAQLVVRLESPTESCRGHLTDPMPGPMAADNFADAEAQDDQRPFVFPAGAD